MELDINKYKLLSDIYEIVDIYQLPKEVKEEGDLLTNKYFLSTDQADLIYEDEKLFIVHTKTKDANKFYGHNSQWCTTKGSFNLYESGNLYIIIDKERLNTDRSDRRVQFHFERNQFMDMDDKSCESFIYKKIEDLRKIFNSKVQIEKLNEQVFKHFKNMNFYDFITDIEKNKNKLGKEEFNKKLESYIENFNRKLYDMGFDKIINLTSNYSDVVNKYFNLSDIKEPSKLTKDLFNGELDIEYIRSEIKLNILNKKNLHSLGSESLIKVGFTAENDSLFITSANYLLGTEIDLSKFDLSEIDKLYVSYFDKIRNGEPLTKKDAELLSDKLSEKQKINLMLFIIDGACNYYKEGIMSVRDFILEFKPILNQIKDMNKKNQYSDDPSHFTGIFEMVRIVEKIESILSNKIISFNQYTILS